MIITTQVFEFLVGSKADIDALDAVSDDNFEEVLTRQCFKGWGDTSSLCCALGKRVHCQVHPQKEGFLYNMVFCIIWMSGTAVLQYAIQYAQLQGNDVATVLDSGDRLGRTPLHYAASQKTGHNNLPRIQDLDSRSKSA